MKRRAFIHTAAATAAAWSLSAPRIHALPVPGYSRIHGDVQAVTGDGRTVTLTDHALAELRARLRGRLLLADDTGYDDARRILSPSFDRRPALIVQPTGAADIQTAVRFAGEHGGLLLAVKCGGHSFSGTSTCDRGMQIDLSLFRDVRVDPVARTAWVTGGSLLGAVDHEAMAHGLVTPLGTVSHTGVGGLVTGGGFGRVARKFGLSIDNLKSVQVVTADGELRRADADENADLFWGVRGGGGNFGIVTAFEFRLHPMRREVIAGDLVFPIDRARDVLAVLGEYALHAPDELSLGFVMAQPPGDEPGIVVVDVCYCGEDGAFDAAVAPVRRLGQPLADTVTHMDYTALQRSGDVSDPRALGIYLKSGFIPSLGGDLISAMLDGFPPHPSRGTAIFFQLGGGAIARVAPDATAFPARDAFANLLTASNWRFGTDPTDHMQAIRDYWSSLERFTHGFYVNDLEPEHSAEAISANYRANHDRLVQVKNRYDPSNLFRLNANVKPTA
ncbi:FAD-binding oxidoreductase [soil metagenome]